MSISQPPSLHSKDQGDASYNEKESAQTAFSLSSASRRYSRRYLLLDLPIAWRLALGFLVAALVAALAAGVIGIQRSQSLSKQTDFYHGLLKSNTSLTTGHTFLELMDSKLQQTLGDASAVSPSHETLASDTHDVTNLAGLYAQILTTYVQSSMLDQHPDQVGLLSEAGESSLAFQQRTLLNSAQRTWQFYQTAQQQILSDISQSDVIDAQLIFKQQGEPTNADALSALHSLIQLNDSLALAVDSATSVEIHNELLTTVIVTVCAFLAIVLVGWFISETLIRRLRYLHRVTRAVEDGRIDERVQVRGRDEIAQVSEAVNAMLDTITGLLQETRRQRDALSGAAEHLFSDMRIVNAGDLRVSATVSNDPIGMLANAFNFTVGRFRRFILRTHTTIEQLDVVARQSQERSTAFISLVRASLRDVSPSRPLSQSQPAESGPLTKTRLSSVGSGTARPVLRKPTLQNVPSDDPSRPTRQVQPPQDEIVHATRDELKQRLDITREIIGQAREAVSRLSERASIRAQSSTSNIGERTPQVQLQELAALEQLLSKLTWEVQQAQFTSTTHFARIEAAFTRLTRLAAEHPAPASTVPESPSSTMDPQFQEFLRQAGGFGVEVNVFSQRLGAIIQEMRSSVAPFRLEGGASMSSDLTDLSSFEFQSALSGGLKSTGNLDVKL